jgi:hypothetical protein
MLAAALSGSFMSFVEIPVEAKRLGRGRFTSDCFSRLRTDTLLAPVASHTLANTKQKASTLGFDCFVYAWMKLLLMKPVFLGIRYHYLPF